MIDQSQLLLWTLIFTRSTGFILLNPILGRRNIPQFVKAGFIMALSFLVFSFTTETISITPNMLEYSILLLKELLVGFILGFVMQIFLGVIIYAGGVIDFQMGLSMANIYDAQSNSQIAITATIYNILFILIFFIADGHMALIKIFISASEIVPYGAVTISPDIVPVITGIFTTSLILAVQLAFPVISIIFLGEVGVGILMKAIPQINVFIVSIQTKILVGFMVITLMFSPIGNFLENLMINMVQTVQNILTYL